MRRSGPRVRVCFGAGGVASGFGWLLISGTKASTASSCRSGVSFRRGKACSVPSPCSDCTPSSSSSERRAAVLAMTRFPFELRRVAGGDEVRLHLRQRARQRLAVGFAHIGERFGAGEVADLLHRGDELVRG